MSKPKIQIPEYFALNGEKADFNNEKIENGYDRLTPDVLPGDCLNKFIDDTYKGLNGVLELYQGAVTYDEEEIYNNKSIIFNIDENNEIKIYRSLVNNNQGNPLENDSYWQEVKLGGGYVPPILSFMWCDHLINDIQWLRGDTFSWQDGRVYKTVYQKLGEEYANGTVETENGIVYKKSANGFKIALPDQEEAILNLYNTSGIAWFYIYDENNTRFKLPRTKFGFKGLRTDVGSPIDESLPNIKGEIGSSDGSGSNDNIGFSPSITDGSANGAFTVKTNTTNMGFVGIGYSSNSTKRYDFNASKSSSTYKDNAPVQERATQMYLYFYVGEYTREAIEQTAGITSEQLNDKVDIDSLVEIKPMIVSYVNGTSGYNIWANGYCEQWGFDSNRAVSHSITLLKTFKDTDYNIQVSWGSDAGSSSLYVSSKGINSFSTYGRQYSGSAGGSLYWKVCGYLAEGGY